MKATPIAVPTKYKQCIITPVPGKGGFDVFEGGGRWFHVTTQKQAKWWASIYAGVEDRFNSNQRRSAPAPEVDHTPKSK